MHPLQGTCDGTGVVELCRGVLGSSFSMETCDDASACNGMFSGPEPAGLSIFAQGSCGCMEQCRPAEFPYGKYEERTTVGRTSLPKQWVRRSSTMALPR